VLIIGLGTLTGSLSHIQQLFLHEKLYRGEDRCFGDTSVRRLFVLYMKLLLARRGLPFYKKPIIAAWSLVIMLLPKVLAERVVVLGYQHEDFVIFSYTWNDSIRTMQNGLPTVFENFEETGMTVRRGP
jgi:hypothetical protein